MWYIWQANDVLPLGADMCVPLTLLPAYVVLFFKTKVCTELRSHQKMHFKFHTMYSQRYRTMVAGVHNIGGVDV